MTLALQVSTVQYNMQLQNNKLFYEIYKKETIIQSNWLGMIGVRALIFFHQEQQTKSLITII